MRFNKNYKNKYLFLFFEPWEFPQSGKMKERAKVGNNNGQQRIANATSCGACKAAWANKIGGITQLTLPHPATVTSLWNPCSDMSCDLPRYQINEVRIPV